MNIVQKDFTNFYVFSIVQFKDKKTISSKRLKSAYFHSEIAVSKLTKCHLTKKNSDIRNKTIYFHFEITVIKQIHLTKCDDNKVQL